MFVHLKYNKYKSWFDDWAKYIPDYVGVYDLDGIKNPKIIFIQSAINYSKNFVSDLKLRFPTAYIIGHHNTTYNKKHIKVFKEYHGMLVGMESMRHEFRELGINAQVIHNAFDPVDGLRDLPLISQVLFSGSIYLKPGFHYKRLEYLCNMLEANIPMTLHAVLNKWVIKRIGKYPRVIEQNNLRPISGRLLHQEIKSHPIVFNCHADLATEATNMRMFEVCAIGSLLITDHLPGIERFFKPGEEILTYSNSKELIEKTQWALSNPHDARKIAEAGHRRALKDHTVKQRLKIFI